MMRVVNSSVVRSDINLVGWCMVNAGRPVRKAAHISCRSQENHTARRKLSFDSPLVLELRCIQKAPLEVLDTAKQAGLSEPYLK